MFSLVVAFFFNAGAVACLQVYSIFNGTRHRSNRIFLGLFGSVQRQSKKPFCLFVIICLFLIATFFFTFDFSLVVVVFFLTLLLLLIACLQVWCIFWCVVDGWCIFWCVVSA